MKKILLLLLLSIFIYPVFSQEKNFIDQPYIEVKGSAKMEVAPDIIELKVIISENDNKKKLTLEELEKQMVEALEKIGIDTEKELFVSDYISNFSKAIFKNDIYTSKEFRITAHDGLTVARIFLELEKVGISNITIEKTDHSKIREFRQQVKVEAVKAAKVKAGAMAGAIEQKAGKAIYIQEEDKSLVLGRNEVNYVMRNQAYFSDSIELKDGAVDFEKIIIEYEVLVRFILE